ncbi:MAG: hypothetical protein ACJ75K_21810 [Actinomycetes bacterium]
MVEGPIELRVHGVSGTPPEAMLDHPHVRRCAGDDEAGFYRRRYPDGLTPPGADRLEAYSWGGLTSGSSLRVLWLLLLPFTLVNVSHFMQPRELPAGDRRRRLLEAVLRLLALSLTLTLVLSVAGVAMDLAAWQCPAASATCSDRQVFLRFLGQGFWHQPGRRVALAALVPTALVWLLWYFGTRTWRGNEQVTRPQGTILAAPLPLQRRELWNGGEPVRRLRRVHVAAALAVVAALVTFPARQHLAAGRAWSGPGPLLGWLLLAGTAVVLAVAVVTVLLSRTARRPLPVGPVDSGGRPIPPLPVDSGRGRVPPLPVDSGETHTPPSATFPEGAPTTRDEAAGCPAPGEPAGGPGQPAGDREQDRERLLDRVLAANRVLAVALVPASMLYAGWPWPGAWEATGALPGFAPAIKALFLVQVVSVAVLLAATLAVRGRMRASASRPLAFAGFGLPVVASMGWMLAGGFAAGLSLRVADFLGTPVPDVAARTARSGSAGLLVPLPYFWAAIGGAALAVAVAWVALCLVLCARRLGQRQRPEVAELYGVGDDPRGPRWPRVVQIARARGRAMASDAAERYAAQVHAATLALVFVGTFVYLVDDRLPLADRISPVTTFGTLVLGGFALALLLLGRRAYRNAQLRRTIGILWDLATFWPRASHPLAPPCYCERALPDLICRMRAAAPAGDRRVVLSAHSQGTVIAAALVLQLEDDERERVRLVTYGSPLRRLYAGAFPVWFGPATLETIGRLLTPGATMGAPGDAPPAAWRWRNLYRRTDPIGGWVVADRPPRQKTGVDWQLIDPAFDPPAGDTRPPAIRGHSGYLDDPAYAAAVATVLKG